SPLTRRFLGEFGSIWVRSREERTSCACSGVKSLTSSNASTTSTGAPCASASSTLRSTFWTRARSSPNRLTAISATDLVESATMRKSFADGPPEWGQFLLRAGRRKESRRNLSGGRAVRNGFAFCRYDCCVRRNREGEAPAEPSRRRLDRLGRSL